MTGHQLFILILVSGAVGGFVDGLLVQRPYLLRLPARVSSNGKTGYLENSKDGRFYFELGSLGDILVGATASVAVFAIADSLFGIKADEIARAEAEDRISGIFRLVAIGVISGFSGIRVLGGLSRRLEQQIEGLVRQRVDEELTARMTRHSEADLYAEEGHNFLTRYDSVWKQKKEDRDRQIDQAVAENLKKAEDSFARALKLDANHILALRGLGKVWKRLGMLARDYPETLGQYFQPLKSDEAYRKAEEIAERMIRLYPQYTVAFYNRSCYRHLLKQGREAVYSDLKKAISDSPILASVARADEDFADLLQDEEFLRITEPNRR